MLQLYNNPSSETTNDHATLQFGVNGGSNNRVNTISAVAESAGNRKLAFAFCTDEAGTRTEKMRITGDGNVGIRTSIPTQELVVNSDSFTGLVLKSTRTTTSQQIGGLQFMNHAVGVSTAAVVATVSGVMKLKSKGIDVFNINATSSTIISGYLQVFQSESDAQYLSLIHI